MRTYLIPGLGGNDLLHNGQSVYGTTGANIALNVALGKLDFLKLNADGGSIYPITVGNIIDQYNPLKDCLNATPLTYDFRLSPFKAAATLVSQIEPPAILVAHSFGGLVLAGICKILADTPGRENDVVGAVIMGSPINYRTSNWSAYQAMIGAGKFYLPIAAAIFGVNILSAISPIGALKTWNQQPLWSQSLQSTISTWDSMGVTLPSDRGIRSQEYWTNLNPHITQNFLDRTLSIKEQIYNVSLPPFTSIYGSGHTTPVGVRTDIPPAGTHIQFTSNGDKTVCYFEQPRQSPIVHVNVSADHTAMKFSPLICESVKNVVQQMTLTAEIDPAVVAADGSQIAEYAPTHNYADYNLMQPLPEDALAPIPIPPKTLQQLPPPSSPRPLPGFIYSQGARLDP